MSLYENIIAGTFKFRPALHSLTREILFKEFDCLKERIHRKPRILDVGGRKSNYTCLLDADIIVSDLPRTSEIQEALKLGITPKIKEVLLKKRSNVIDVVFDDMTKTELPAESFDGIICIEVIEHVSEYEKFIDNLFKVLRPGGVLVLTTPNGDFIPNNGNPDHVQHFKSDELHNLLQLRFNQVSTSGFVKISKHQTGSLGSWNLNRPVKLINTFYHAIKSYSESKRALKNGNFENTWHL